MRSEYSLKVLCEVLDVKRAGYHAWKRRGVSKRALEDDQLAKEIEAIFDQSGGALGSPKVHHQMRAKGFKVGVNRVARLMRERGLVARSRRVHPPHPHADRFFASFENTAREVELSEPNQVWVGDVTYLKVNGQWRYLAVVLDKFSRRVLGWSLSTKRDVKLSLTAIKAAARKRLTRAGMFFHSDKGSEYLATKYRKWLECNGIVQSVNRKGVMNDNAEMESFFQHLKAERLHSKEFFTERELRSVITEYVAFYNHRRPHQSLDYQTPVEFEARMA